MINNPSPAKKGKRKPYDSCLIYVTAMKENAVIDKLFRNMNKDYKITWGNKMFEQWVSSFNLIRLAYETTDNIEKYETVKKLYYTYRTVETYIKYGIESKIYPISTGAQFIFGLGNLLEQTKNWMNTINRHIQEK